MDTSEYDGTGLSRRTFLGATAGLTGGIALGGRAVAAQSTTSATVMTRNAYLGVDLARLFEARSLEEVRRIAGELLASVEPARYGARAGAIADEIAAADADVVALQEAALLRTQRPGDFSSDAPESASNVVVDFLEFIQSALDARDLNYDLAAATVTTDVELPAETGDGPVDVRVTDRDALLVRSDLQTGEPVTDTFEAGLTLPVPGTDRQISLRRGFCLVDVLADGVTFTTVSTHLESVAGRLRRQQAEELLDRLPGDRPVFLCGDFNSGPGGEMATYDLLTDVFTDAYATQKPDADGFTCCQAANLGNEASQLDRRIDAVLYRGDVRPTAASRVGHEPGDRIEVQVDGETTRIWPSDHAGVVGTFEVTASTPTPSATPTATPQPTPTEEPAASPTDASAGTQTPGGSGPGLGVFAAIAGIGGGLLARLGRR